MYFSRNMWETVLSSSIFQKSTWVYFFFISDINYLATYMLYLQDFNNHGMFFFKTIDRKILWKITRSKRGSTKEWYFHLQCSEPQIDFHGELIGAIFTYEGQCYQNWDHLHGDAAAYHQLHKQQIMSAETTPHVRPGRSAWMMPPGCCCRGGGGGRAFKRSICVLIGLCSLFVEKVYFNEIESRLNLIYSCHKAQHWLSHTAGQKI